MPQPPNLPIYARIEADLRREIADGRLPLGSRVPTEQALAERYGVARMTVRHALDRLTTAGLLVRRQGIGTFVAKTKIERVASRLLGFAEDALAHGLEPSATVLGESEEPLGESDAHLLDLDPATPVLRVSRLRATDGEPIGHNTVVVVPPFAALFGGFDWTGSFYAGVAERVGVEVSDADQTVEATPAPDWLARALAVPVGAALLSVTRVTRLADGRTVGLTRTHYRGDRYFLSLSVRREGPMPP